MHRRRARRCAMHRQQWSTGRMTQAASLCRWRMRQRGRSTRGTRATVHTKDSSSPQAGCAAPALLPRGLSTTRVAPIRPKCRVVPSAVSSQVPCRPKCRVVSRCWFAPTRPKCRIVPRLAPIGPKCRVTPSALQWPARALIGQGTRALQWHTPHVRTAHCQARCPHARAPCPIVFRGRRGHCVLHRWVAWWRASRRRRGSRVGPCGLQLALGTCANRGRHRGVQR